MTHLFFKYLTRKFHIVGHKGNNLSIPQAGADPNQVSHVGRTPLHEACQGGHVDVLCLILDYTRSIINAGDQEGQSPAHMAAFHGEVDCLEVLTDRGGWEQYWMGIVYNNWVNSVAP